MLKAILILSTITLAHLKSVSQVANQNDSTALSFTIKWSAKNEQPCGPSDGYPLKFQVINSTNKEKSLFLYISKEDWPLLVVDKLGIYNVKGTLSVRDYIIYGCFSAFQTVKKLYITPTSIVRKNKY